jgi:signal peptidase
MKKKIDIKKILNIAYGTVLVLVLLLAVLVIFSNTEVISGYSMYVVESGSMEPAIHTGSVIVVSDADEYEEGDIVTVQPVEQPSETYTHRIDEITDPSAGSGQEGESLYITKGDANDSADITPVTEDQIVGKVDFSVPLVGYAVTFSKTQLGFILLVVVPMVLIIANEVGAIKKEVVRMIKEKPSTPSATTSQGGKRGKKKSQKKKGKSKK